MLVLSRKKNETIYIGDDIVVTVVRINGNNVRLGIEAPKSMNIVRKEVYDNSVTVDGVSTNLSSLRPVRKSEVGEDTADPYIA